MCVGPLKKKKQASAVAESPPPPPPGPAATAVMGDRAAVGATPDPLAPFGGLSAGLSRLFGLKIPQADPNAVGAGRIGRAFGASDLRIGG